MKVAINGFGRIGRLVFRILEEDSMFDVVAINDLSDAKQLSYLLKYDTVHGRYKEDEITYNEDSIIIDDRKIKVFAEKDPVNLPWKDLDIDIVFECTGVFRDYDGAHKHIEAGAKKVLISSPAKGDIKTIVYGVNEDTLDGTEEIVSASSCTTNCLAPVINLLNKNYRIRKGAMTTIHAYTNDQEILDVTHKKGIESRRGRAGAANIIPTSTGAAESIGLVIPDLAGKMDGCAMRVPVTDGSVIDLTLEAFIPTTKDNINNMFKENQNDTLKYTDDPVVSSDIIGTTCGGLVDGSLTQVIDTETGQLIKVVAWYDNEYGYSSQMVRTAKCLFK